MPHRSKHPPTPLAELVKESRIRLEMNQEDFAKRVGVGLNFLRDLEQGKRSLRLDKINQVLEFIGYEMAPIPKHHYDYK